MKLPADSVLSAREERAEAIASRQGTGRTVLCLHANLPGPDKNRREAFLLAGLFAPLLPAEGRREILRLSGADGPALLFVYDGISPAALKASCVAREETHPLGRFVDLDVFGERGPSLSRKDPRPCWMCGKPAHDCARSLAHPTSGLLALLEGETDRYFREAVSEWIREAVHAELDLDPKFGLVTPTSRGSHPDMDYALMDRAEEAIRPFLAEMFLQGTKETDPLRLSATLRETGKAAEAAMFSATGGINAYKGLIFSFGLLLGALGALAATGGTTGDPFSFLREMAPAFLPDDPASSTFGALARKAGFGGIRAEAARGFPSVRKALPFLRVPGDAGKTLALVSLIASLEDSVLLKRAGSQEAFRAVRSRFETFGEYDPDKVRALTSWCVEKNLSFGGAADLLVLSAFLASFPSRFSLF